MLLFLGIIPDHNNRPRHNSALYGGYMRHYSTKPGQEREYLF